MSTLRDQLAAQLARFDEEAFVALANRGLYRRALKDLEKQSGILTEESAQSLTMAVADHRVVFDASGPAHARCSCPATGVCQHILAAAISLQRLGATQAPEGGAAEAPADLLAPLQQALMAMTPKVLAQHAGKAGYRWAWQFVLDLGPEAPLTISGDTHLVLSFQRPRLTLRYMGGGPESLIADGDIAHIEKYRVAAVLAYQQAHGAALTPPEPTGKARTGALDLGKDHAVADLPASALQESRARLRASATQLLGECVELGLAHLSRGIHERFATLAVWAQGAEYHRLAMLLRRLADHVEMLLERAGGADEHVLFDELSLALGLVAALESAAAQGAAPSHLVGRSRSTYESASPLELLGLGAMAWRSASGYRGLTMLFWSPAERAFFSCTDARPENQRGFNPVARYKAAGPWSGLGAPAQATGRRVVLTHAVTNAMGRLSAAEGVSATVMPVELGKDFAAQLPASTSWAAVTEARRDLRRSLLAEPEPMKDWVVLQPRRFGTAQFEAARQTLLWSLYDDEERCLNAELAYSDYSSHAMSRIEQLRPTDLPPGTRLVARLRAGALGLVAEPLSLVHAEPTASKSVVDALHFDVAPEQGLAAKWLQKLKGLGAKDGVSSQAGASAPSLPDVLREMRQALQRQAERGISAEQVRPWQAEMMQWAERAGDAGFVAFKPVVVGQQGAPVATLQANYICLQYERLIVGVEEVQDGQ